MESSINFFFLETTPNEETKNGRILVEMAERQEMTIANTVDKCIGTITRERVAMNNTEKAVLDYILICEQMTIDEKLKKTRTTCIGL